MKTNEPKKRTEHERKTKMKNLLAYQRFVLVISLLGGTCGNAQLRINSQPVRHTVTPDQSTAVEIKAMPNAACVLGPENSSDARRSIKLYTGDSGVIRFHARPAAHSDETIQLVAECQFGSTAMTYRIELRAASAPTSSFPAPASLEASTQQKRILRPALTGDAMALSETELLQRGYPPRPDPQKAPEAYSAWLGSVSRPTIQVSEQKPARYSGRVHGPAKIDKSSGPANGPQTSNIWSGFALSGGASPFNWVMGEWIIPSVSPEPGFFNTSYSSLWIGLDGEGNGDVVQDGTEQDAFVTAGWGIEVYYAWTEWWPLLEQPIFDFFLNPGDIMFSEVWVGDADGLRDAGGSYGWFYLQDLTNGHATVRYTPIPKGTVFWGNSAEWIMERPTEFFGIPDLANYHSAVMWSAAATRQNWDYPLYTQEPNDQFTMINPNDGHVLSTVVPTGAASMQFYWHNFN
jgi:hypothetical protein